MFEAKRTLLLLKLMASSSAAGGSGAGGGGPSGSGTPLAPFDIDEYLMGIAADKTERAEKHAKRVEERCIEMRRLREILGAAAKPGAKREDLQEAALLFGTGHVRGGVDFDEVCDHVHDGPFHQEWPKGARRRCKPEGCKNAEVAAKALARHVQVKGYVPANYEMAINFCKQVYHEIVNHAVVNYACPQGRRQPGSKKQRGEPDDEEGAPGIEYPIISYLVADILRMLETANLADHGDLDGVTELENQLRMEKENNKTLLNDFVIARQKADMYDDMSKELERLRLAMQDSQRHISSLEANNQHLHSLTGPLRVDALRPVSEDPANTGWPREYLYEDQWQMVCNIDQRTCVVCQDGLSQVGWYTLGCGHRFHLKCVVQTMKASRRCPLHCGWLIPENQYAAFGILPDMPELPSYNWLRRRNGTEFVFDTSHQMNVHRGHELPRQGEVIPDPHAGMPKYAAPAPSMGPQ